MSEREELSRKLLEENGLRAGAVHEVDRAGLRAIVEAERKRGAHLRNVMVVSWALAALFAFGAMIFTFSLGESMGTVQIGEGTWQISGFIVLIGLLLAFIGLVVALVSTIAWGLRMAFGPRGVEERLERIEAQLARLEAAQGEEEGSGEAQS